MNALSPDEQMLNCYAYGDMIGFSKQLELGANPNCRVSNDKYAYCILIQAIYEGNSEATRILIEHGADLTDSSRRMTACSYAVFRRNYEILDILFRNRSLDDLQIAIDCLSPPILTAVVRRDIDMIRYLVTKGCDINLRNEEIAGHTPVEYAVRNGDLELTEILLKLGADPARYGLSNYTAFDAAEYSGIENKAEMLSLLHRYVNVNGTA